MNISNSTVMHWNVNTYNKSEKVKDKLYSCRLYNNSDFVNIVLIIINISIYSFYEN